MQQLQLVDKSLVRGHLEAQDKFEDLGVKAVIDLFQDEDMTFKPAASRQFFKEVGVPASYYNSSEGHHQKEMLDHSIRKNPDHRMRVCVKDNDVNAVGPVIDFTAGGMIKFMDTLPENLLRVGGNFDQSGQMHFIYGMSPFEVADGAAYFTAYQLVVTSLFYKGVVLSPMVYEVVCTNGLVDLRAVDENMKIGQNISPTLLEFGLAAFRGVNESLGTRHQRALEMATEQPAIGYPEWEEVVFGRSKMPKSFLEKGRVNYSLVSDGKGSSELPSGIGSLRDELSCYTFTARGFNERTRFAIESNLMSAVIDYVKP